jgi:hypothetical protein
MLIWSNHLQVKKFKLLYEYIVVLYEYIEAENYNSGFRKEHI